MARVLVFPTAGRSAASVHTDTLTRNRSKVKTLVEIMQVLAYEEPDTLDVMIKYARVVATSKRRPRDAD